jgi:hypothetical protein
VPFGADLFEVLTRGTILQVEKNNKIVTDLDGTWIPQY